MPGKSVIAISEPRLDRAGPDLWRVVGTVAGTEVYFESTTPLSARSESLVCPFLMPAMALHADLEVDGALDPDFLQNLGSFRRRASEWWPELSAGEVRSRIEAAPAPAPDAGVFYTGGIDSSYVLQQLHPKLRYAVFVEGFDIKLTNTEQLRFAEETLGATAAACGVEFLVVRTNLRAHPLSTIVRWGKNHIGPLAAIAHALGQRVHTMYVAASDVPPPHGSAPDLDASWSSGAVKIQNFSAELSRLQRAASVGQWKCVRGRLRPCLVHNPAGLNCGACEKCVRTRMQLFVTGSPDGLGSFDNGPSLRSAVGDLSGLDPDLGGQWREIAAALKDRRLLREVERLVAGKPQPYWRRRLRALRRNGARRLRAAFAREATERHASS
jgi:hypothetical protein